MSVFARVRDQDHQHPEVTPPAAGQNPTQGSLDTIHAIAVEHHRAVLTMQSLYARRGGILSEHYLTTTNPSSPLKDLDGCRSFAVLNFSPITIQAGVGGRQAIDGSGFPVGPWSYLQLPVEINPPGEVAASAGDLAAVTQAMVAFIRFHHLVNLAAGPLTNQNPSASTSTANSNLNFGVTNVSQMALPANPAAKGRSIVNNSANPVTVTPGAGAAVAGQGYVIQPGGVWNGSFGGVLWDGRVNIIAAVAGPSIVAIVEV